MAMHLGKLRTAPALCKGQRRLHSTGAGFRATETGVSVFTGHVTLGKVKPVPALLLIR